MGYGIQSDVSGVATEVGKELREKIESRVKERKSKSNRGYVIRIRDFRRGEEVKVVDVPCSDPKELEITLGEALLTIWNGGGTTNVFEGAPDERVVWVIIT